MENKKALKLIDQGKIDQLYPLKWFRNRTKSKKGPHVSSIHLAKLIKQEFPYQSCLDLGAGALSFANEMGKHRGRLNPRSVAVEASEFNREFEEDCLFIAHNLCKPLYLNQKFDLVTSWDVIEHIPAKFEKVIVSTVVRHVKGYALLSIDASKWGRYHVNCRPKGYWQDVFINAGLIYERELTKEIAEKILQNPKITSNWYARNLLIFKAP